MAHELVVRSGLVADGLGGPAAAAVVAIDGDRIVAVGEVSARGTGRVIEADGRLVTPVSSTSNPISMPRWAGIRS